MAAALPLYYTTDACPPGAQTGPCAEPTAVEPTAPTPPAAINGTTLAEPFQRSTQGSPSSPAKRSLDSRDAASPCQTIPPVKDRPLAVKVPGSAGHLEGHSPQHAPSPHATAQQHPSLPASPSKAQPHSKSPGQGPSGHHHGAGSRPTSRPTSPHGSKAASHAARKGDWTHVALQSPGANPANAFNASRDADLETFEAGAMLMHQAIMNSMGSPSGHHQGGGFSSTAKDSDT